MLPTPKNYAVYPSVFPVGEEVTVTVLAEEPCFIPPDGALFTLTFRPVDGDEDYYAPHLFEKKTVEAKDGALRVSCVFEAESEYILTVERDGVRQASLPFYALDKDLFALRPMKGDLHTHSYRSDGARDPASLAGHFREQGYDFFALTDHNRYYPGNEIDAVFAGVGTELLHVPGEEVHTPGSVLHIVHMGGDRSVAHRYIHEREAYEKEVGGYLSRVPETVPEEYRDRYARAMWATDQIHAAGGLAVLAHPLWRAGGRSINIPVPFARLLLASGMFDAFEVFGGIDQPLNDRQVALWQEMREQGTRIPVVGSSDVHHLQNAFSFPYNFTVAFVRERTVKGVLDAVRESNTVAVLMSGEESARRHECVGSLRFVSYAQFLLHYYFPNLARIASSEGVLMRAYAMGDADAKAGIEAVARAARTYRARFFGDAQPPLPGSDLCARAERFRRMQIEEGPLTRGSKIDGAENRQI